MRPSHATIRSLFAAMAVAALLVAAATWIARRESAESGSSQDRSSAKPRYAVRDADMPNGTDAFGRPGKPRD